MIARRTVVALAAALLLLNPLRAPAQEAEPRPSQVVRVTAPGDGWIAPVKGTVLEASDETLLLDVQGVQMQVQRVAITRLEISEGKRNRAVWGAYGAVLGLGLGYAAGRLHRQFSVQDSTRIPCTQSPNCPRGFKYGDPEYDTGQTVALLVAGTAIGAFVGAMLPGERWRTVNLHSAFVPADPRRARLALSVAIRF